MNGDRDILERTAAELKALSLTVDTLCMGLEREHAEPQTTASLKTIGMGLRHIQQNINYALTTEQDTR